MKKLLSIVLAILFIFSHGGASGYQTEDLPGGGKKITCKYEDLENIKRDYKWTIESNIRDRSFNKQSKLIYGAIALLGIGTGACIESIRTKQESPNSWWKTLLIGIGVSALGFLMAAYGLFSNPNYIKSDEFSALEHINTTDTIKPLIDFNLSAKKITEEDKKSYHYDIFVDKKGYVYKTESGGNGFENESNELNKSNQYKFPFEIK